MMEKYEKPMIDVADEYTEGIYLASGEGSVSMSYMGVWDRWANGGKANWSISFSGFSGPITVTCVFNDTVEQAEVLGAATTASVSGNTVVFNIDTTAESSPLIFGIHLNHEGASIDALQVSRYSYTAS